MTADEIREKMVESLLVQNHRLAIVAGDRYSDVGGLLTIISEGIAEEGRAIREEIRKAQVSPVTPEDIEESLRPGGS